MSDYELPPYSERDIARSFDRPTLERAQAYANDRVISGLSYADGELQAFVQGSARKPYQVTIAIELHREGDGYSFDTKCTCPVGYDCKHAAAALLYARKNPPSEQSAHVRSDVLKMLDQLQGLQVSTKKTQPKEVLRYVLHQAHDTYKHAFIEIYKVRLNAADEVSKAEHWENIQAVLQYNTNTPRYVQDDDGAILRLLLGQSLGYAQGFLLDKVTQEHALELMAASGRLYLDGDEQRVLSLGEPRDSKLIWQEVRGLQQATLTLEAGMEWILLHDPWYVDRQQGVIGRLRYSEDARLLRMLLQMPALNDEEQKLLAERVLPIAASLPLPRQERVQRLELASMPVLRLQTLQPQGGLGASALPAHFAQAARSLVAEILQGRSAQGIFASKDVARLYFAYAEHRVGSERAPTVMRDASGGLLELVRDTNKEARYLKQLKKTGLSALPNHSSWRAQVGTGWVFELPNDDAWVGFIANDVPRLRAAGWQVEIPPDFRHVWLEVEAWDATLNEDEDGWFGLDMGIMVEGERLPLTPLLHALFAVEPRWLDGAFIEQQADDADVFLHTPEGKRIRVKAGRIKLVVRQLIDLFGIHHQGDALRLHRLDVERIKQLPSDMTLRGAEQTLENIRRVQELGAVRAIEPPTGLGVELRPYQQEGLSWLAHLRELKLGGILADDMGLGKTAQTLAFLLREKQLGRLDKPALVILPTSLVFNWRREAERIAPDLRVLTLHGNTRHESFAQIAQHDLVLSTYPLVWRDIETLEAQVWSILILDEAQTVKNAASQAAQAVRRLKSEHRLSLTGTPMENHLGELWAQFDFLLPGFLGDSKQFTQGFRTPIEKQGDSLRRDLLARRVRPFMLRRRKQDVALELPPKTIVVRSVQLEGMQRDLYETVRSAMDSKVREAIAQKGLARSHIILLEALLKLRQVCCDPRLLAGEQSGRRKNVSAKLDLLMSMLPELVDEGRRILLFSQFTSMLDLISAALDKAKIKYVLLTGQTREREMVVNRFQNGEVPVFLISLKAGGVGLNLTAADTVIHYDPWWNPAAEDQATDRAHRIGQTKQVFVYKLVAEGSIEEKILALQEKKAALAAGVLGEDATAFSKFNEEDLQALFAPLPKG